MSVETSPLSLVAELHRRQGEMYAGGSVDSVIAYFERRRKLANATMQMHPGEVWLVPLDGELFDRLWGSGQAASGRP